jgi:branched-chain amino acid transport system ATP-binding protein
LELARALAAEPKLLLLDEIAGGLTEQEVNVLVELVRTLKGKLSIIWIEHVAHALLATCDRIMVLHFGRKIIEGEPRTVMTSPEVREIYMGIAVDAPA